jgi:hypothetical protein
VLLTALFLRTGSKAGTSLARCKLKGLDGATRDEMSALKISKALQRHILRARAIYWKLIKPGKTQRAILPELAAPEALSAVEILGVTHPEKADAVRRLRSSVMRRFRRGRISGDDLQATGVKPGPGMADILRAAHVLQAEGYGRKKIFAMLRLS